MIAEHASRVMTRRTRPRRAIAPWLHVAVTAIAAGAVVPAASGWSDGAPPMPGMASYQLVLMTRRSDARPMGEREIVRHQADHLAYLARLRAEGKLLVEGPVDGGGDLRSLLVLDVPTTEQAEGLLAENPWVRVGRMRAEVHPWWAQQGILRAPDGGTRPERCYVALLRRPDDAPEFSEQKLRKVQAGHMEHIRAMAESGDLVLAGPMGDDGPLRGIFVFRTLDPDRLVELIAPDPAIKAGLLGVELYPWNVPSGTIPPPAEPER